MVKASGFKIANRAYSFHLLGQLSDMSSYLICRENHGFLNRLIGLTARLAYVESKLLRQWPGLGLEIVAIKE